MTESRFFGNCLANLRKNYKKNRCITVPRFNLAKFYYTLKHVNTSIVSCIILHYEYITSILYCIRHQSYCMCGKCTYLPYITEQFKGTNFNQNKDSLMIAFKKYRNMLEIVYLLCSHFGESKVNLINLTLYGVLYTVLPLIDLISNANNTSRKMQVIFDLYFETFYAICDARNYKVSCIAILSTRLCTFVMIRVECWTWKMRRKGRRRKRLVPFGSMGTYLQHSA